jgi:hypothetical protein
MKNIRGLCIALFLFSVTILQAQQIDSLLRGVYLFSRDSVDYSQMRNSLNLNAIQQTTGWMKRFILDSSNTRKPDTIIYLKDATIYFYDKDISRLKGILK